MSGSVDSSEIAMQLNADLAAANRKITAEATRDATKRHLRDVRRFAGDIRQRVAKAGFLIEGDGVTVLNQMYTEANEDLEAIYRNAEASISNNSPMISMMEGAAQSQARAMRNLGEIGANLYSAYEKPSTPKKTTPKEGSS